MNIFASLEEAQKEFDRINALSKRDKVEEAAPFIGKILRTLHTEPADAEAFKALQAKAEWEFLQTRRVPEGPKSEIARKW